MYFYGKAPVRLSFGSCADTNYYMDSIGWGNGINATINSYCYCSIKKRPDNKIYLASQVTGEEITYEDLSKIDYNTQRPLNLTKAVLEHYGNTGIDIVTYSDAPLESGLGGSAAHTISLIRAFNKLNGKKMPAEDVARLAYKLEREKLGIPGGYQDQWAAAFRGINQYIFRPNRIKTSPLNLSEEDFSQLEEKLLLVYVKREKQGTDVHIDQKNKIKQSEEILKEKRNNVAELIKSIKKKDFDKFGRLLGKDWEMKKSLSGVVTQGKVNKIYETALAHGILGGRFMGAGETGCALFYCENKEKVFEALKPLGATKLPFKFERRVVQIDHRVRNSIFEHQNVIGTMIRNTIPIIQEITKKIIESYKSGGRIILFGNGGSAADAQHIAAELINKQYFDRPMLDAVALTVNTSIMTAISNDRDFKEVFARQIENMATDKDIVIGISTSGNSENVLRGIEEAKENGVFTIAFTGQNGGIIKSVADLVLPIPSNDVARIQEGHILVGHIVCENVERELFGDSDD